MTTSQGDGIVKDFYQRGTGELAAAYRKGDTPASDAVVERPSIAAGKTAKGSAETIASDKQRKLTRDQRLILALARLLASRTR